MDLFGRKRRIAQLEDSLATQQRLFNIQQEGWRASEDRIKILEASELKLMGQIREMDQLIWNMGQQTTESGILNLLRQALPQVERRKNLESDRIKEVLIPEMKKAYRDESAALEKRIPSYFKKAK